MAGDYPGMLQVSQPVPSSGLGVPRICPGERALLPRGKLWFLLTVLVPQALEMEPQPCCQLGFGGEEGAVGKLRVMDPFWGAVSAPVPQVLWNKLVPPGVSSGP